MNKQNFYIRLHPTPMGHPKIESNMDYNDFSDASIAILNYLKNGRNIKVFIYANTKMGVLFFDKYNLTPYEVVMELVKECERLFEDSEKSDSKKSIEKIFPSQPIPIDEVEKALGIELYEWQREFMLNETLMDIRRASGKTFLIVLMYTLGLVNDLNYDYIREKSSLYGKKSYNDYVKQLNNEFIEKLKHTKLVLHRIN